MASTGERRRNNVRAGVFVTLSIAAAVAVIVILSGKIETLRRPSDEYTASFDVASGIRDLQAGSTVRVGGLTMGRVTEIEPAVSDMRAMERIDVHFSLDRRVRLYDGVDIRVQAALIGGGAWLEITDVGDGTEVSPGGRIDGAASGGLLENVLGPKAPEILDNTDAMIAEGRALAESLNEKVDKYDERITPTLDDVRELVAEIRDEQWPRWADVVDNVMTWADEKTADIDVILGEGKGLLTDARETVGENRPRFTTVMDNVEDATGSFRTFGTRVNEETLEKVHTFLDRGQEGLDDAIAAVGRIRQDYEGWSTDLDATMGNATLASQQLKLAMAEIRRSPWKVLYRPSADELDHELLYEAARSFAMAATDLKAASDSVQRVLAQYGEKLDEQALARIQSNLIDSLGNYERAQDQLFEILVMEESP